MMIFVDASAFIAIIAGEPDSDTLVDLLETQPRRLCSPLSVWETVAGLCHSHTFSVPAARDHVERFLNVLGCEWVSIGEREYNPHGHIGQAFISLRVSCQKDAYPPL
jgi:ribonuclease VapC